MQDPTRKTSLDGNCLELMWVKFSGLPNFSYLGTIITEDGYGGTD